MRHVRLTPAAREEFLAAVEYYESASPNLGAELVAEVERGLKRIVAFPEHGSPHVAGTHRLVLHRFPFDLVYLERSEGITVVAVAHQRQRPGYWRTRL